MDPRPTPLLLPLVLAAACSSAGQKVPMPDQAVPLENPAMCRIYVLRDLESKRQNLDIDVYDGETHVGTLVFGEYLCWERAPGVAAVKVEAEPDRVYGPGAAVLEFDARAGHVYYCETGVFTFTGDIYIDALASHEGRERALRSASAPVND